MGLIYAKPSSIVAEQIQFEKNCKIYQRALLKFKGVDGYDVYNCSVPFEYKGKTYIFGRVERPNEWVHSNVFLFEQTAKDQFTRVKDSPMWNLQDPFVVKIHGEMVFGGTHVTKSACAVSDYRCQFYHGKLNELKYFTSGPALMKDIRLIELANGKIGVFTHFRTQGSCLTGFITIDRIQELSPQMINSAKLINHRPFGDAWGGPNQAYLLSTGKVGCISHHGCLLDQKDDIQLRIYVCTSYVFDPETYDVQNYKIIGTKRCFPPCKPKLPRLADCAFVSGIVMRDDGKCDLYSGLGDTGEGRITIDYPFEGYGRIVSSLKFD